MTGRSAEWKVSGRLDSADNWPIRTFDDDDGRRDGTGDRVAGDAFILPGIVAGQVDYCQIAAVDRRPAIQRQVTAHLHTAEATSFLFLVNFATTVTICA